MGFVFIKSEGLASSKIALGVPKFLEFPILLKDSEFCFIHTLKQEDGGKKGKEKHIIH